MGSQLINSSDRIFVACARGMAGSAIVRALIRKGYGKTDEGGNLLAPSRSSLNLLDDMAVREWMKQKRPDVVVLAAATVGGIEANRSRPADFLLENIRIQTQVIESAWRAGVRRLLFLGSSCIYPKFADQPIKEESLLSGSLEPTNVICHRQNRWNQTSEALRIQHGFDAISLMPTNLYGPGDNYHHESSHVLPAMIRRFHEAKKDGFVSNLLGTGRPLREFYMLMIWVKQACLLLKTGLL